MLNKDSGNLHQRIGKKTVIIDRRVGKRNGEGQTEEEKDFAKFRNRMGEIKTEGKRAK